MTLHPGYRGLAVFPTREAAAEATRGIHSYIITVVPLDPDNPAAESLVLGGQIVDHDPPYMLLSVLATDGSWITGDARYEDDLPDLTASDRWKTEHLNLLLTICAWQPMRPNSNNWHRIAVIDFVADMMELPDPARHLWRQLLAVPDLGNVAVPWRPDYLPGRFIASRTLEERQALLTILNAWWATHAPMP